MSGIHLAYGVEAEHYEATGEALIGAVAELLEDDFDDASRSAWLRAYRLLSDFMIDADGSEPPAEMTGR